MAETLRWGLDAYRGGRRIALGFPPEVLEAAKANYPVQEMLEDLAARQYIWHMEDEGSAHTVVVNTKTIGRLWKHEQKKQQALRAVHELVSWIGMPTRLCLSECEDPNFELLSFETIEQSGSFGFAAELTLSDADDITLARAALGSMVSVAYDIRLLGNMGSYEQYLVAQVDRQLNGVALITSGQSSVHTLGEDFRPGERRVELWGNNVWAAEEPLVYLAGSIALAHAKELVTP